MKRVLILLTILTFICCTIGCQQGERVLVEPKADVEADIQAIKDIVAELEAAVNNAEVDRYVSFYADDIIDIFPNEPAVSGKEANRDRYRNMFEEVSLQDVYNVQDVKVSGDLAVAHVELSAVVTIKAREDSFKTNGNWIIVFERQSDETWKVIYSIWSDESLVRPERPD